MPTNFNIVSVRPLRGSGLIVCAMRHLPPSETLRAARLALRYQGQGVVGFDLAGAERVEGTQKIIDVVADRLRIAGAAPVQPSPAPTAGIRTAWLVTADTDERARPPLASTAPLPVHRAPFSRLSRHYRTVRKDFIFGIRK